VTAPDKQPWDVRLTERWARQAREAANDPRMRETPTFRKAIKSPPYWVAICAFFLLAR